MTSENVGQALAPLLARIGGRLLPEDEAHSDDVRMTWPTGEVVYIRLDQPDLGNGLGALLHHVEVRTGRPLHTMSAAEKREAVNYLRHHGAFGMRRAAQLVANAMGVSRYSVYKYLNASESPPTVSEAHAATRRSPHRRPTSAALY